MVQQLPLLSGRQLVKLLGKFGYKPVRQTGSHIRLFCEERPPVTVPNYKQIDRSLIKKILRDAKLNEEELNKFLKAKKWIKNQKQLTMSALKNVLYVNWNRASIWEVLIKFPETRFTTGGNKENAPKAIICLTSVESAAKQSLCPVL